MFIPTGASAANSILTVKKHASLDIYVQGCTKPKARVQDHKQHLIARFHIKPAVFPENAAQGYLLSHRHSQQP